MAKISPGQYRFQLTLQTPSGVDGMGQTTWVNFANVRAKKLDTAGKELNNSQMAGSQDMVTWEIRYIPGITPEMRIADATSPNYYVILSVHPDPPEAPRLLHLECREVLTT